jgi:hypothetical protein
VGLKLNGTHQLLVYADDVSLLEKNTDSIMALQPYVGPWSLFQFLNLYTVGRTPWTRDEPVARPLTTHRTTKTQNKRTQTNMPRVGFEPMTQCLSGRKQFMPYTARPL